jgi:hypothetical protein
MGHHQLQRRHAEESAGFLRDRALDGVLVDLEVVVVGLMRAMNQLLGWRLSINSHQPGDLGLKTRTLRIVLLVSNH